jgi:hypothetical protein
MRGKNNAPAAAVRRKTTAGEAADKKTYANGAGL